MKHSRCLYIPHIHVYIFFFIIIKLFGKWFVGIIIAIEFNTIIDSVFHQIIADIIIFCSIGKCRGILCISVVYKNTFHLKNDEYSP